MDFDLRQLDIFCRVVEHASFTRAAAALDLAQATVSEHVSRLERAVGARLLDRLGRRVVPTAVGRHLHRRARALLGARQDLRAELQALLGARAGAVTLGASTIPGEYILPGAVARFRVRHPEVHVTVAIDGSGAIVERVAAGELELGVVGAATPHPHLTYTPLWSDELVLAVPPGHAWAARAPVPVAELGGEPMIGREAASGTRRTMEQLLEAAHPGLRDALTTAAELGSTAAVKEGVRQGLGVAILSRRAVAADAAAGALAVVPVAGVDLARRFHLVRDTRRNLSPACARFAACLEDEVER